MKLLLHSLSKQWNCFSTPSATNETASALPQQPMKLLQHSLSNQWNCFSTPSATNETASVINEMKGLSSPNLTFIADYDIQLTKCLLKSENIPDQYLWTLFSCCQRISVLNNSPYLCKIFFSADFYKYK